MCSLFASKYNAWLLMWSLSWSLRTCGTYNATAQLFNDFIRPYDSRVRPIINGSQPIVVYVSFNLMNLLNMVEVDQVCNINGWMNFSWTDQIRTWDPSQYDGIDIIYPAPKDLWRPRSMVSNSVDERDIFEDDYAPFALFASGITRWYPGAIFSVSCVQDMTYFPFDDQTCSIRVLGHEYAKSITFLPSFPFVISSSFTNNGEWDLVSSEVVADRPEFGGEQFMRITFYMTFRRHPDFFMVNVVIPVVLLSLLSSWVFVLPEESGERASFSITVLLSLSVFMGIVSSQMPQNSETFPIIIMYLFVLQVHNGLCVFTCVFHLRWVQFKSRQSSEIEEKRQSCNELNGNIIEMAGTKDMPFRAQSESQNLANNLNAHESERRGSGFHQNGTVSDPDHAQKSRSEHNGSMSNIIHRKHSFPAHTPDKANGCHNVEFKTRQRIWNGICNLMKDASFRMFASFNIAWAVISTYYLYRLLNKA